MNLYLSRLCLNPLFAPALKLAADPYELHRKLLDTLPCGPRPKPATENQPKTADLLFRVDAADAGPVVLVQRAWSLSGMPWNWPPAPCGANRRPRRTIRIALRATAWR